MNTLSLVLSLIPAALRVAKAIEAEFPQGGQGQQKLDLASGLIADIYDDSQDLQAHGDKTTVTSVAVKVISRVVKFLNDIGVFGKAK